MLFHLQWLIFRNFGYGLKKRSPKVIIILIITVTITSIYYLYFLVILIQLGIGVDSYLIWY